ncbi:MAG: GAF domain-containing protein [Clostridia bacterium]|nr:GAF domain-containing protein [Clostridia bacterium]
MDPTYRDFLSDDPHHPGVLRFGGARMALLDIEAGLWGLRRQLEALVGPQLTDAVLQQAGANGGASFARSFVGQGGGDDRRQPAGDGRLVLRECVAAYQAAGFGRFEIEVLDWPVGRVVVRAHDAFEAWMVQQHGRSSDSPVCAYTAGVLVGFVNVLTGRHDVVCIERACQAQGAATCLFELLPAEAAGDVPVVAFAPSPGLIRQLNMLELLFDRMPMGVAVLDREYRIQRYNPTWQEFADRYAPPSAAPLRPGVYYFDHLPGTEPTVVPLFERVLAGETIRQEAVRLEAEGIVTYWDVVLAPLIEDGEVVGILNVTVDATEREEARRHLEQRVEERTHELRTLLQVSQDINSRLELESLLDLVLDQLKTVVDYTGASILILDGEELSVCAYRGPIAKEKALQLRFPLEQAPLNRWVIQQQEPLVIADVRGDAPPARMFQQVAGEELRPTFDYIRSWLGVPLIVKTKVLGMLTLDHNQPGHFTTRHADLALAFANQVAIAIENARLYARAEETAVAAERSRLARDLHDAVTQTLFSASLIAEVLPRIWERDPAEGQRQLEELRELTRGALTEMRTLLLELRPSALAEAELGDLLRQLAESVTGRARVSVALSVEGECSMPPEVKVAFYRIAQEALSNVVKHAGASRAEVHLRCEPGRVDLRISDDGRGFDAKAVPPESLGLGIMRERAEAVGATLRVGSQMGEGTWVVATWAERGA